MKTEGTSLLRPQHFAGLTTRLTRHGLMFRATSMMLFSDNADAAQRPPISVEANPHNPSLAALKKYFKGQQCRHCPGEGINTQFAGLDKRAYERNWAVESDPEIGRSEGQEFVLVARALTTPMPIGFFSVDVRLTHDAEEHQLEFYIEPVLVYVTPRRRGHGYGLDLSVACVWICDDILTAAYRAVPPHTVITGQIDADYESNGGEKIGRAIHQQLCMRASELDEYGGRRSVRVEADFELCGLLNQRNGDRE